MRYFKVFLFLTAVIAFLTFAEPTEASLVTIDGEGKIIVNVLASEDSVGLEIPTNELLEVKNLAADIRDSQAKVSLNKSDGKVQMNVSTTSGEKSLDVTGLQDDLIEIEERPRTEKLVIRHKEGEFVLVQGGVVAHTSYEIGVDPEMATITLKTPSGLRYLSVLPKQAVNSVLRTNLVDRLSFQNKAEIKEEDGEVSYTIKAEKLINVFDIFEYPLPVTTKVSASTGELVGIEEPKWLRFVGFLFV
jgi:hypothetical protein